MLRLDLNLLTLAAAVSYLTLGIFTPDKAERWWAWYAGVTFLLSAVSVWKERRA